MNASHQGGIERPRSRGGRSPSLLREATARQLRPEPDGSAPVGNQFGVTADKAGVVAWSQGERVRAADIHTRPLGYGTSTNSVRMLIADDAPWLGPAWRRVLPWLLASIQGEVDQPVVVVHRFNTAAFGPVGLEDPVVLAYVAHQVEQADLTSNEQRLERRFGRVPGELPAHEVAIADTLVVGPLA